MSEPNSGMLFPGLPLQGKPETDGENTMDRGGAKFKTSDKDQIYLFPESLDDYIGPFHLARFISKVVDGLDLGPMIKTYKGGGASAFHPATLMKIWLFGWTRKIYTCRPLAEALTRDVEFMWIAERQEPCFMTLNDFRKRIGQDIKKVFKQIVKMAMKCGMVNGEDLFIDHTKMEADANKNKMVWRKQVERRLAAIDTELDKLLDLIDRLNDEEEKAYADDAARREALKKVSPALIDELIADINADLKAGEKDRETAKQEKASLRRMKELQGKKEEYEEKAAGLDGRNSMSKTDPDAVAMMMKDHLSVKPGYNVGIATQNGIVTGYDVSDNSNDGVSFKTVLAEANDNLETQPERVCADAGYGTAENYRHLEEQGTEAYVKYPGCDKRNGKKKYHFEDFSYDSQADQFRCPNGKALMFFSQWMKTNPKTGNQDLIKDYVASEEDCSICPLKDKCTKGKARKLSFQPDLLRLRKKAKELLESETGKRMRSRRSIEVETVFGVEKRDYRFHRFHVRGITGATIESGLFFMSLNLTRMYQRFLDFLICGKHPIPVLGLG